MNARLQPPAPAATPAHRPRRSVWFWLRLTLLSLLLLCSSTLALLGNSIGLQLLWYVQPTLLPALQIGHVSGDLWHGVRLQQLHYQQDGWQLSVTDAQLRFDLLCLWQRQLCLPQVRLHQLRLIQAAASDTSPKTPAAGTDSNKTLQLPFSVAIAQLQLSDSQLQLPEQHLQLQHLQTKVVLTSERLILQQLLLEHATVQLTPLHNNRAVTNPLPALLTLKLPLALALPQLVVRDFTLQQDQQTLLSLTELSSDVLLEAGRWQLQQLQARLQQPQATLSGALAVDHQAQTLLLDLQLMAPTDAQMGPLQLSAQGQGRLKQWQLQVNSTAPWALALALQTDLLSPTLRFDGQLNGDDLHWPVPSPTAVVTTTPATAAPQQSLQLRQLGVQFSGDLDAQQLHLSVASQHPQLPQAEWTLSALHGKGVLQLSKLQLRTLNGNVDAQATLHLASRELQATLAISGLQPGLYWADYPGELSGAIQLNGKLRADANSQWSLNVSQLHLDGTLRDQPLQLNGQLALRQPVQGLLQLQTPGLILAHGPNQLQLNGALTDQLTLDAKLHIADLAYSLALAEGAIDGELQLRGDVKKPDLFLTLTARNLSYLDDYSLADIHAKASLPALGERNSQISLVAKNGQAPGWQLQQLDWQSEGTQQQHQTHLVLDSHQLKAVLAMQAGLKQQQWQSTIRELRLQSDMGDWQLQQPWAVRLDLATPQAELGAACWWQADATLCLDQTKLLSGKQGALALRLSQVPLSSLDPVLPPNLSLDGLLSGQTTLRWQQGRLAELNWQFSSTQGVLRHQLTTPLELPWHDLTVSGGLKDYQLSSSLRLVLAKDSALAGDLTISNLTRPDPKLKANLQLAPLSLAFLQPVFNEFSKFDGLLSANLRAEGALQNPAIYGALSLDALQLTGQQAPLELTKANLLASFRGFAASLSSDWHTPEGRLSLNGDANWLAADAWFAQLNLQGEKLQLQLMDADLTVSPRLQLAASPHSGQVTGDIDIPAGHIRFNSLPENATRVSDDEVVITAEQRAGRKSAWKLSSDVRLKIGEQVKLAAFGLKTRLQGNLRVRQQGLLPTLHGQVLLKDGSFRAYGQDLTLRKGRLTFNGPASQPLLAIEAIRNPEKTEDEVIAGLRVNGLADNPLVEVFSEPSKPQANALAYLLLGRDIGSSAGDGAVTTGLIGIGIANSGQLVGALGEAFGISDLSLDTAGSGDKSKVTVSGYLSPRLQVKYGVGIFSQFGEFTLRYRLMQQVYVEAVQGLATSVDLLYKMEFD